jgi:DNA processing protein
MAVPGPITSAMSIGCHELLRTGEASLVSSVEEIVESVGRLGTDLVPTPEEERRETDNLTERSLRVHEALDRRSGLSAEQIAIRSGIPLDQVRATLPGLELTGHAERCETGWRRPPPTTATRTKPATGPPPMPNQPNWPREQTSHPPEPRCSVPTP